jgi:phage gp36-like protein
MNSLLPLGLGRVSFLPDGLGVSTPEPPYYRPFSYATFEEFIVRFGERETLDVGVAKVAKPVAYDRVRVEASLGDATDLIDSYLIGEYDVTPLHLSPSGELRRHTVNIARFYLAQHRDPELYRFLYEEAIAWCEAAIVEGRSLRTGEGVRVPQRNETIEEPVSKLPVTAALYGSNNPRRSFSQEIFYNTRQAGLTTKSGGDDD